MAAVLLRPPRIVKMKIILSFSPSSHSARLLLYLRLVVQLLGHNLIADADLLGHSSAAKLPFVDGRKENG